MWLRAGIVWISILIVHLCSASGAAGVVLITNYPPANELAAANIEEGFAVAAGFTLPAGTSYVLTSATVRLHTTGGQVTAFSAQLFGDGGSGPRGPALVSFSTPTFTIEPATRDYVLAPTGVFTLQPSTTYWLALSGDVPSVPSGLFWIASFPGIDPTGIATSQGYRQGQLFPPPGGTLGIQPQYQVDATPLLPASIPTLGEWGMLGLLALLVATGVQALRRRTAA